MSEGVREWPSCSVKDSIRDELVELDPRLGLLAGLKLKLYGGREDIGLYRQPMYNIKYNCCCRRIDFT